MVFRKGLSSVMFFFDENEKLFKKYADLRNKINIF